MDESIQASVAKSKYATVRTTIYSILVLFCTLFVVIGIIVFFKNISPILDDPTQSMSYKIAAFIGQGFVVLVFWVIDFFLVKAALKAMKEENNN